MRLITVGTVPRSLPLLRAPGLLQLLRRANELVKNRIHPTTVMSGYRLAMREAVKYIKANLIRPVDELGREVLINAAKTSMASKILGPESDFFADLAVRAVSAVRMTNAEGKARFPITAIHILKCHGKSATEVGATFSFAICSPAGAAATNHPEKDEKAKVNMPAPVAPPHLAL